MNKKELAPGIVVYSDVIPNHQEVLQNIKDVTENKYIVLWQPALIIKDEKQLVDLSHRKVDVIGISFEQSKEIILNPINAQESFKNKLGNLFYVSLQPYIDNYMKHYGIISSTNYEDWQQEHYQLLRYSKNNFFNNHYDDSKKFHRRISVIYYLNDNYTGGEITFNRFEISYKPKANDFIIFPSTYVYSHSVSEVTEGTRYALVTWMR